MKSTPQNVWLRKAGALVACSVFAGSSTPTMAHGGTVNLPVAANIPLGHFPTVTPHNPTGHTGGWTNPWTNHSGGATNQNGHHPVTGLSSSTSHTAAHTGSISTLWHGQPFLNTLPHMAGTVPQSLFGSTPGSGVTGPGLQLDLTATGASIVLGSNIFQGKQSVTINMGGSQQVFAIGAHVTAAEYVAIRQVLAGGGQTLRLNSQGAADGGTFSVNTVSSAKVTELVVPTGVTALDYASKGASQGIDGDILNYGTIYGVASRGQGNTVTLNAQDIVNETGGLITTRVPSSLLAAFGGVLSPINLSLSATDNISNSGKIVSSGSVSLSSGTGTLNNSGLISSLNGGIHINGASTGDDINVSASGGTFSAPRGDITVRDASYTGNGNIYLNGGDYLSKNFNLYSGTGTIDGSIGQVTGRFNTTAGADHLQVATANLLLGNNKVSDPTFVNSAGNIQIVGSNQFSEDVAIIAAGNITAAADGQIVDSGHNVTLVAGANIKSGAGSPDSGTLQGNTIGPTVVSGNTTTQVTIDTSTGSLNGGNIDLHLSNVVNVIDTSSKTGAAGNVTMAAFGGQVTLAKSSIINASGGGSGKGGDVTIIAGSTDMAVANVIQIGGVKTGGGTAGGQGGSIGIYTAAPISSDFATNKLITFDTNGAILTGNTFQPGAVTASASMTAYGDLVTSPNGQIGVAAGSSGANAGNITIAAGSNITTQNLLAFGGGGAGGDSVNLNGGAGGNGGNISVTNMEQFAAMAINGQVNASGGGGGGGGSNGAGFGTGGSGGNAGTISILQQVAGGSQGLSISGGVYAAQGGTGGTASLSTVGGGGASYGGGGGGGSSGTGGVPGTIGTSGTIGGGAGGAGYFGGGGGDVDGAGGGGGYTGGAAGGSGFNASAGSLSTGGGGTAMVGTAPAGGKLVGGQQGGQGVAVGAGADGSDVSLISGANDVTLSSTGRAVLGGDVFGKNVSITEGGNLAFNGNVVGTSSVVITIPAGAVSQPTAGLSILTPTLTLNLGSTPVGGTITVGVGAQTVPLVTNAQTITATGSAASIWLSDSATATKFDGSKLTTIDNLGIVMNAKNAALDVAPITATMGAIILNVGASLASGNSSINLEQNTIPLVFNPTLGSFGATITANNLTWTNAGGSNLAITANGATGGTISLTVNQVNGSGSIAIGTAPGQLSLSATASGAGTAGGSISIIAPTANLTIDPTAPASLQVTTASGNGGKLTFNVGSIASTNGALLALSANGAGNGNGGTISVTTNNAGNSQSIGVGSGEISLSATNGGGASAVQNGGSISFINLGAGSGLVVDPAGIAVNNTTGAATSVNGGSITLTGDTVKASSGPLVLNSDGFGSGNGGRISVTETTTSPSSVTLGGPTGDFNFSAQSGATGGNGGSVTFSTQGALLLNTDGSGNVIGVDNGSNTFSAAVGPQAAGNGGGSLTLTAFSFANANAATGAAAPLIFNAPGLNAGSGGHIRITELNPAGNLTIGKSSGDMEFIMTNGATGVAAGTVIITISNPSNNGTGVLTVDPTAISELSSSATNLNVSGGFIQLVAPTIVAASTVKATSPLVLNVSGAGTGNGGAISIEESNATSNMVIGTKAGQFELLAAEGTKGLAGTSGGSVLVASGGNLTVNPAGINVKAVVDGNGGHITLSALNLGGVMDGTEGNLLVTGAINANGTSTGSGGTIGLSSNSTNPFNVGLTVNNLNGVKGGISLSGATGGNLGITSAIGGTTIQTALTTPGFITIGASVAGEDVNINATVGGAKTNAITIAPVGAFSVTVNNIIGGTTGKLVTSSTGEITLAAVTDIRGATTTTTNGVTTTKQLQMSTLQLTANATNGDIDINDKNVLNSTLLINGMTAGDSINLSSSGSIETLNGMTAVNVIDLTAQGYITTGGNNGVFNLAVTDAVTHAASSQGVSSAPTVPPGSSPIHGGGGVGLNPHQSGHSISPADTNVDSPVVSYNGPSAHANFATSSSSGSGQAVPNVRSGNLVQAAPITGSFSITSESDGQFFLIGNTSMILSGTVGNSNSTVFIQSTASGGSITGSALISGKSVALQTTGGDLGASGLSNALQLSTPALSANTGGQGSVYINSPLKTFGMTASSAASFKITTFAGANLSNLTSTGGDISLTSRGTSSVSGLTSSGSVNIADTLGLVTFSTSTASNNIVLTSTGGANISGLTSSSGTINITTNAATKVVSSQSSGNFTIDETKGLLTVTTVSSSNPSGAINITGATGATVTGLTNNGDVTINGGTKTVATNVTSNSGSVTIESAGAATLTTIAAATGINITDSGTTVATNIATTSGPINFKSAGLGSVSLTSLSTGGGDINLTTGGVTTMKSFSAVGDISATTGGATTLGSMSTTGIAGDGDIKVTNTTGLLQISTTSKIYAQNGAIELENLNTKAGSILIGASSDIETGTQPIPGTGGNITITIGPVGTPQAGVAPSSTLVTSSTIGTGAIDWGLNGISAVVSKLGPNLVTAKNAEVIFNTGPTLKGTAIKLNGDITIVADPPFNASLAAGERTSVSTSGTITLDTVSDSAATVRTAGEQYLSTKVSTQGAVSMARSAIELNGAIRPPNLTTGVPNLQGSTIAFNGTIGARLSGSDLDTGWVSETELDSGLIPAVLFSDGDFGIHPEVSSVIEMVDLTLRSDVLDSDLQKPFAKFGRYIRPAATNHWPTPQKSFTRPQSGGVNYCCKSNVARIALTKGSVVFAPSRPTIIETPYGVVNLAVGSLVLVLAMKNGVAIYDFDDRHHAAVTVVSSDKEFILTPGSHMLICENECSDFDRVNPAQLFAYRNIRHLTIASEDEGLLLHAFSAEFNIPLAIGSVTVLKQLANSHNSKARKIAARVLKTSVIIAELTSAGKQYQQALRPRQAELN